MTELNEIRATITRLVASAEALAAVGVHLSVQAGRSGVPAELATRSAAVADALLGDTTALDPQQASGLASLVTAMLGQAASFVASPDEPAKWAVTDPVVLQSLGQVSAAFAPLIRDHLLPQMPGAPEALAAQGAAILDVGVGVGALAIAFAQAFPAARVVGLDVWPPALQLARANVERSGLDGRIEAREQDVAALNDVDAFDLVWFAGQFIPGAIQPTGLRACAAAPRPGGWLVYGAFGGSDALSAAMADLRTARSGGPVLTDAEIATLLIGAGLVDVTAHRLDVGLPARLVVGRRA